MDVKTLAKEIEEFMDAHCECPSRNFNRAGCIEQIILNHITDGHPPFRPTVVSFIREEN